MAQVKAKAVKVRGGSQSGTAEGQKGAFSLTPPTVNTGRGGEAQEQGRGSPSGAERYRINTTLPEGIYQSLEVIARATGKTLSQVALGAIEDGLISQGQKARNVLHLKEGK